MPRQLPWKINTVETAVQQRKTTGSPSSSSRSGQLSIKEPVKPKEKHSGDTKSKPVVDDRPDRSPPTSPIPEPPKEEFMIEGLENDDQYRMVEDEFLAVAREFTRHLHAAEYQRLRAAARSQNAKTIQSISRPVTGAITDNVTRQQLALKIASKQRDGLAKLKKGIKRSASDDEEQDEEMPWAGTSLQGLMDSPQKKTTSLTGLTSLGAQSRARASTVERSNHHSSLLGAVGDTAKLPSPTQESRRVDGSSPSSRVIPPKIHPAGSASEGRTAKSPGLSKIPSKPPELPTNRHSTDNTAAMSSEKEFEDDDNDGDLFASLRHRRAEQRRKREQRVKKEKDSRSAALDEIPLF